MVVSFSLVFHVFFKVFHGFFVVFHGFAFEKGLSKGQEHGLNGGRGAAGLALFQASLAAAAPETFVSAAFTLEGKL